MLLFCFRSGICYIFIKGDDEKAYVVKLVGGFVG